MLVMTTTIRLRGPADIISVLPYHLGYQPTDSILLVCLRGSRLVMVARMDLPPPDLDPGVLVDELLPPVLREHPDLVSIVCFEDDAMTAGTSEVVSSVVRDALARSGVTVANRLLVRAGRWWSLERDGLCGPPDGLPLPAPEEVPAIAQYIVMGRDPARDREGLVERVSGRVSARDPLDDTRCAALIRHLDESGRSKRTLSRFRRDALRHWGRVLSEPPTTQVPAESWSWACVSMLDIPVRDLLVAWLCPGTLDLEVFSPALLRQAGECLPAGPDTRGARDEETIVHDGVLARLEQLCRRAPRELAAGPLTLLAQAAWWHGDGALARIAVEEALAADPAYRLALLVEPMIDFAMRPERTA